MFKFRYAFTCIQACLQSMADAYANFFLSYHIFHIPESPLYIQDLGKFCHTLTTGIRLGKCYSHVITRTILFFTREKARRMHDRNLLLFLQMQAAKFSQK